MIWLWTTSGLAIAGSGTERATDSCAALSADFEPAGAAGRRRVALVVGSSTPVADGADDLPGPEQDARDVGRLLRGRFAFPPANVCVLTGDQATTAAHGSAFDALTRDVSQGDIVVHYFAGLGSSGPHGSSLLLHDSRTGDRGDLTLAQLDDRVAAIAKRTDHVVVLTDAARGPHLRTSPMDLGLSVRWTAPALQPLATPWTPSTTDGVVWLFAARDGTAAKEQAGRGLFTQALMRALHGRPKGTWYEIHHDLARWIATSHTWQRPEAFGDLSTSVFGATESHESWQVVAVSAGKVQLKGPSLPGYSPGAVLALHPDGAAKADTWVRLDDVDVMHAVGTVLPRSKRAPVVGDWGRLQAPGADITAIRVRFDIDATLTRAAKRQIQDHPVLARTVLPVQRNPDFVVKRAPSGEIDIVGADGVRRNRLAGYTSHGATDLVHTLGLYARQASLLALTGASSSYPSDMLSLRLHPHPAKHCARTLFEPVEPPPPTVQVPMCNGVTLEVRLKERPRQPLHLGILYLANNGSITAWSGPGFRMDGKVSSLSERLGYVTPPLQSPDRIVVFGTHQPIDWQGLAGSAPLDMPVPTRGNTAQQFITSAITGGLGTDPWSDSDRESLAWTARVLTVEVVADPLLWTPEERNSSQTCSMLRARQCQAPSSKVRWVQSSDGAVLDDAD
ncbi:MAG: caspase family protein [Myxococcales bacterium]|nr:caspase family protein [Myxococcales bacterium]